MFAKRSRDWPGHDYYAILGVPVTATPEEIVRAYRRLARTTHPDIDLHNSAAAERFEQLTAAREVLGDPVARAAYDRMRSRGDRGDPNPGPADEGIVPTDPVEVRRQNRSRDDPRRPAGATIRVGPVIWAPSWRRGRDG
jgi:curved DNA-binding protein CbpA